MYTMVLMMAVTSGGEVSGFGHRNKGCNGGAVATGCSGYVAVAPMDNCCMPAPTGCTGMVDSGSCHGGAKKGFLGLGMHDRLFGHRNKNSCHGGSSCLGSMPIAMPECCPPGAVGMPGMQPMTPTPAPPPKAMPKTEPKTTTDVKPKTESN